MIRACFAGLAILAAHLPAHGVLSGQPVLMTGGGGAGIPSCSSEGFDLRVGCVVTDTGGVVYADSCTKAKPFGPCVYRYTTSGTVDPVNLPLSVSGAVSGALKLEYPPCGTPEAKDSRACTNWTTAP